MVSSSIPKSEKCQGRGEQTLLVEKLTQTQNFFTKYMEHGSVSCNKINYITFVVDMWQLITISSIDVSESKVIEEWNQF